MSTEKAAMPVATGTLASNGVNAWTTGLHRRKTWCARPLNRRGIAAFCPGQITLANTYFAALEANLPRVTDKRALISQLGKRERGRRQSAASPQPQPLSLLGSGDFPRIGKSLR